MVKVMSVECRRMFVGCHGSVKRSKVVTINLKVMATGSRRHIHRWKTAHSNLQSIFPGGIMLCAEQEDCVSKLWKL